MPTPTTALVIVTLAVGLLVRAWILHSPLGTLESDEAITGLMARRTLHGDLTLIYWLSNYGGSQESLLTAFVFAIFGSSVFALKVVPLTLFAVATVLVWRVGRRIVGEPGASIAAAVFWVWPAYFVWWTLKARGFYAFGLVCELVVLLFVLRLGERDSRLDAALLGFALGMGWWATPEVLVFALPSLAWLAWRRPQSFRLVPWAVPALAVGAAPWIAWNVRNHWLSLHFGAVAGSHSTYLGRLGDLFKIVLPTWLGLRIPFSLEWIFGRLVGVVVVTLVLALFTLLVYRRRRQLEPLVVIALAFPFLYAASSFAYYVREPRYLVLFAPVPALLVGWAVRAHWGVAALTIACALVLSVMGLHKMEAEDRYEPYVGGKPIPSSIANLIATLERHRVTRVYANYWLAYRISFESGERVLATSTGFVRDQVADRAVHSSSLAAHVFVVGEEHTAATRLRLKALDYRTITTGEFAIYLKVH